MDKKIKVINYPWHLSNQYELYKVPGIEWFWITQYKRNYAEGARGDMVDKYGIQIVPHYEPGKYDLAILHLDQQCFEETLWERGKGSLYREVNSVIQDIPKIVVMHGTPYYPEMFKNDITEENYEELGMTEKQIGVSSQLIKKCKEAIGDNVMVCNSHRAREEWGFGETIIHGLDADEWFDLPKEPRVVTMISPAGLDAYYDRTFLRGVREALDDKDIQICHITVDVSFKNWMEYRNFLGKSLIYLNLTRESPMPRARTEAMFSGCCIVTTPWHDADSFIKDGINGFLIKKRHPNAVVGLLEKLLYDYKTAVNVGQKGKETAKKLFNGERFRNDWLKLINNVLKK